MNTWKKKTITLIPIILGGILLLSVIAVAYEFGLHNYLSYNIFVSITAEATSTTDDTSTSVEEETTNTEGVASNVGEETEADSTASKEPNENTTETTDSADENTGTESSKKENARKEKVERVIQDLPEKMSAESTSWRRFPIDFTKFNLGDITILKREEGESDTAYRLRINRFFTALCTIHAAGGLKDTDWEILIKDARLCSVGQTIGYELRYLELSEQYALENDEYAKFVGSPDSELLNIRRGTNRSLGGFDIWSKREKSRVAYINYKWLTDMVHLKCFEKPEYAFLKAMWESTDLHENTPVGTRKHNAGRLPDIYTEFYLHIKFPKELLEDAVKETGGRPELLDDPENVRVWLSFVNTVKKDPHFFDEFKRKHK